MCVNAVTERSHRDAATTPFVGTDRAKQFGHRYHVACVVRPIGLPAGLTDIGRPAICQRMGGAKDQQHHAEHARPLRSRQAHLVEPLRVG